MNTKHTPGPWVLDDLAHSHVVDADYHVIESGKGYHLDGEESDGFNVTGCISLDDASLMPPPLIFWPRWNAHYHGLLATLR